MAKSSHVAGAAKVPDPIAARNVRTFSARNAFCGIFRIQRFKKSKTINLGIALPANQNRYCLCGHSTGRYGIFSRNKTCKLSMILIEFCFLKFSSCFRMIEKQAQAGRCLVEIRNALNHDSSTCCPHLHQARNKSKKSQHIDVGETSSDSDEEWKPSRARKRRRIESSDGSSKDASQANKPSPSCSKRLNDAVRRVNDDSSSDSIELISDSSVSRAQNDVQPESSKVVPPIRIESVHSEYTATHQHKETPQTTQTHNFLITVTTINNGPIYHTINGHKIELNSAAQQNPIRLPDGKTIHVRKLMTNAAVAEPAPIISQPVQIHQEIGQHSVHQFQSLSGVNSSQAFQQFTTSSISYSMQSTESSLGPRKYATGPVGDACTQFERQIFNAVEICQSTEVKLRTLMNSNAYKTVRNVNDIKELLIHMSYLLSFTLARYKALQDSCIDDLRKLGFRTEADSLSDGKVIHKYGSDSDVNEVEIVEPKHATINLDDSDDEEANKEEPGNVTTRLASDVAAPTSITAIRLPKVDRELTAGDSRREHDVIVMVLPNDDLLPTTHRPFQDGLIPKLKSIEPLTMRDTEADGIFSDNIRKLFEISDGVQNKRDPELNNASMEQSGGAKTIFPTKKLEHVPSMADASQYPKKI